MRYKTETLLRDELSGHTAYAISLVLDSDESSLEVLDELVLTLRKSTCLLLSKGCSSLLHDLECRRSILDIVA